MELLVNGEKKRLDDQQSVSDLVNQLGLGGRAVAVEVNKQLVPRKQHATATLRDGDAVEIVTLVGGG